MADRYQQFVTSSFGRRLAGQLGLPTPVELRRYEPGKPIVDGPVLVGGSPGGRLVDPVLKVLHGIDATVFSEGLSGVPDTPVGAAIFDATGVTDSSGLRDVYTFFHGVVRHLGASARVLVLGTPPQDVTDPKEATAQRALEGFVRSAGKEMRKGTTANLVYVSEGGEGAIESTLRFLLSGRSAYVSGQPIRIGATGADDVTVPADWDRPLDGRVAVVTGAARGIGAAIAETLSRDGADVVCLDLPSQGQQLSTVANRIGGATLQLDITADDAPERLLQHLEERHGGVDIVVHNAGVTRDKTLAGMDESRWDMVIDINLAAQERINDALLESDLLRDAGRIVCVSSVSGIAGNRGQSNYAASKAGVIGMVRSLAPAFRERGATINAVAPGFIETEMTAAMPLAAREVGRRINSLAQGGRPVDVAETIAWLAHPASSAVNGEVVRVCGQQMIGA